MNENWYALFIAIQLEVIPEQAFMLYEKGKISRNNTSIDKSEVSDMIKLKSKGNTYKEIGKIYGISSSAVYLRIKSYQNKNITA